MFVFSVFVWLVVGRSMGPPVAARRAFARLLKGALRGAQRPVDPDAGPNAVANCHDYPLWFSTRDLLTLELQRDRKLRASDRVFSDDFFLDDLDHVRFSVFAGVHPRHKETMIYVAKKGKNYFATSVVKVLDCLKSQRIRAKINCDNAQSRR
jgi:hypothetical protein